MYARHWLVWARTGERALTVLMQGQQNGSIAAVQGSAAKGSDANRWNAGA